MALTKAEIRALIRQRRQEIPPDQIAQKSKALCEMVMASLPYRNARTIYGYLPFRQEVDLRLLLESALAEGKAVALPKCRGHQMDFIRVTDFSGIQYTAFGVPEPIASEPVDRDEEALVILPGAAFDRRGFRVGYGGGCYDRYLAAHRDHPTVGLCFDFQMMERLPVDAHDLPADTVFWI